ncbi:Mini-ribonuclease 3 [Microaerobacter geothermalis]|uniref:Mini-ribonuclease 3 n=1 Tax=Microaerobacter geothermalis TaxID=674972 RepID=UPI001F16B406|nr:Mini-ribonuclease 3 [Microaerobacter geothermalis]MCF6095179.1 Mini-ribonuclease 3 [Microaerobacter geothermalis]
MHIEIDRHPSQLHPLVLAYIGDAVYEVLVRQKVASLGILKPERLHKAATNYVSAKGQAYILSFLYDELTEEEKEVVRRGRNTKSKTSPKNTDILLYRHSTGFEALIGYLFLMKNEKRLMELIKKAFEIMEMRDLHERLDHGKEPGH